MGMGPPIERESIQALKERTNLRGKEYIGMGRKNKKRTLVGPSHYDLSLFLISFFLFIEVSLLIFFEKSTI